MWGKPAFFGTSSGGYIYVVESNGYLRAFKFVPGAAGGVSLAAVGTSAGTFGFSSGSPAVTSIRQRRVLRPCLGGLCQRRNRRGCGIAGLQGNSGRHGQLKEVFSAPLGIGAKFSSVATEKGRVYVGTRDGHVLGFGAPTTSAVGAKNTDLGNAKVGTAVDRKRDNHRIPGRNDQLHHHRCTVQDRNLADAASEGG